jgi:hypothetical protein
VSDCADGEQAEQQQKSGSALRRDGRDAKLWSLLPAKDDPYDFMKLSKAETDALVEAFGDGFGGFHNAGKAAPLPTRIKSGVLEHSFYVGNNSEYDHNECDDAFWDRPGDGEEPAPSESFPLKFQGRRLRVYFQNQFDRFCARSHDEFYEPLHQPSASDLAHNEWICEELAFDQHYQKPWYEIHALQFLNWIEDPDPVISSVISKHSHFARLLHVGFAGQLGRLVEQYYWRFRFEEAVVTGIGARKGASAGGKAKAQLHRTERKAWQIAAVEIWARRPSLSKLAVAQQVKKQLRDPHTAKHIARYIGCRP